MNFDRQKNFSLFARVALALGRNSEVAGGNDPQLHLLTGHCLNSPSVAPRAQD